MICSKIQQSKAERAPSAEPDTTGLQIDQANRIVLVDGRRVSLSRQSYDLLCYLYEHAHQLCARREIVEQVFGFAYDEMDESQRSRLNTAMSRLRERIEDDPRQPRYLRTEPSGGYRLVLQPEK